MKVLIDDDIKIQSKRLVAWEHKQFLDDHRVFTDGNRKILVQKCVLGQSDCETLLAILNGIATGFKAEVELPEFIGDHLIVRITSV